MHDHSNIMWLTNEEQEANNGRNANVCSLLFAIGRAGGKICPTWTVLITVCTFPNTSDVTSIDLSYVLIQQM